SIPATALVDEALFDAAQEQVRENRTRAREGRRHPGYSSPGPHVLQFQADMHITQKAATTRRWQTALSIIFTTAAPALTAIDSAGGGYAQIRKSEVHLLESAVWAEVRALLESPKRLEERVQTAPGRDQN